MAGHARTASSRHTVYSLHYHFVFTTKYRKPVLVGEIGQSVRIVDGPFMDFTGTVDDINLEKGKVKVLVSFFGRETPVELDFLQVERL